ncbi:serine hydrolase domain-containing protein [Ramlibacter algicola]|uniref:Serine hydrolase n=1 Tax=Ramlibacter algicola TaxID=2795217 RepID=A0A934US88_9BURK|nr:serine hydrolase [Ramlibacter algicola]MBK0393970.1 serine hydrolase [Ramlibacter algicola]
MTGFPPPADQRATLANWRTPPFNRWAFHHVSELVPSAFVRGAASATPWQLEPRDLDGFRLEHRGRHFDFRGWLDQTFTDSFVVLRDGKLAFETYAGGQDAATPHIWMSVSKSVLGLVAGIAVGRGQLDVDARLETIVPELEGSAFAGATVRDALDMRVGIHFDEDYHARSGPIIEYRKAHLWDPLPVGEQPSDLRSFLCTLKERDGEHGGRFHYVSPNTDLLGWVLERATGTRYADLVSDTLWKPIGAERDAYITVDRFGAPRCAGGFCATPRDMARLGRLFVTGGRQGSEQVVPEAWIRDIVGFDGEQAWQAGDFFDLFSRAPMHYRSKWYVLHGPQPLVFGVGVFGQHLFIDPAADLVIAMCASQPLPLDESFVALTMAGVEQLRAIFQ